MNKRPPNFTRLDSTRTEVSVIIAAMLQARQAVERRAWASPQQPTDDYWWGDVLSDPRARGRRKPRDYNRPGKPAAQLAYYTLPDEPRPIISVARTKCGWIAEFSRAELVGIYGAEYPLPNLLDHLASPTCAKVGSQWDRCGAYYVNPIG
jgi:hypothetical protein